MSSPSRPCPWPLLLLLAGCGGATTPPAQDADVQPVGAAQQPTTDGTWHAADTANGTFHVRWRPEPGSRLLNEPVVVEVEVLSNAQDGPGSPLIGAEVAFQADMPAHGHGMLREPRSTELGEGRYRVDGVLLHMEGHWVVNLDVVADGVAERAAFELEVR